MTVVNPLVTYTVPYGAVTEVRGGGGETLNLVTRTGDEIHCTAFGGSVIDSFVGSAARSAERIEQRVKRRRKTAPQAQMTKKLTVSWIADVCTVGATACVITAAALGG
ncbi:hypothetical protein AB0O07_18890 [Streptomyces sp. NPDC093085]|uniref:hypothetical protein n=1 Tax=Streptomyces sp. NPDC093085 TaxID=3155068 RepID=UPI00341F5FBF